jgi:tetratricopeptide (TPR) repeat protein
VLYGLCRFAEAERVQRQSISYLESVEREFSGTNWGSETLERCWGRLCLTLLAQNRPDEAITAARTATEVRSHRPNSAELTAWSRYRLGLVLYWTGQRAAASDQFRQAIPDLERLGPSRCRRSRIRQAVAYATCPCEEFRDLAKGVELAQQTSHPQDGQSLRFLGIALYRAAAWQQARQALEQALPRLNGGDAIDFFYLAMTNAMLGDQVVASRWYQRAIDASDAPLIPPRFEYPWYLPEVRSEAERTLGLQKQTTNQVEDSESPQEQKR